MQQTCIRRQQANKYAKKLNTKTHKENKQINATKSEKQTTTKTVKPNKLKIPQTNIAKKATKTKNHTNKQMLQTNTTKLTNSAIKQMQMTNQPTNKIIYIITVLCEIVNLVSLT